MDVHKTLATKVGKKDHHTWQPQILTGSVASEKKKLLHLLQAPHVTVCDTIEAQLLELVQTRIAGETLSVHDTRESIRAEIGNQSNFDYGHWVYYPWSGQLVHVLTRSSWHELRTNRNRYLITDQEQRELRHKTIGVVGLSVGQSAAFIMGLEGIGGYFRLADHDRLELSNMNRLKAGVHQLGLNKAILAARQLYETDPFLELDVYTNGISDENIERFLLHPRKLDLLVEECDDLYIKLRIRELAREFGIPVVMETSDRGMLDIERFDLESNREIFHGLLPNVSAADVRNLSTKDKIPMFLAVAGVNSLSTRMAASLVEMEETIVGWPQLASSVNLGGAIVANTARRLFLENFRTSGRFFVDLTDALAESTTADLEEVEPFEVEIAEEARTPRQYPKRPAATKQLLPSPEEISYILEIARYAPSANNSQPWEFTWDRIRGLLLCRINQERAASFLNYENRDSLVSIGASLENIALTAPTLGLTAHIEICSGSDIVAMARFERTTEDTPDLFPYILTRQTNRRSGTRTPLTPQQRRAFVSAANPAKLQFLDSPADMKAIGELSAQCDQLRILSKKMHKELVAELRWSPREVTEKRDGIDLATMALTATDKAVLKVIKREDAMRVLGKLDLGNAIRNSSRESWTNASAAILITYPGRRANSSILGGRGLQRLWLTATKFGLFLHPYGFPGLFRRLGRRSALTPKEHATISRLCEKYRQLFCVTDTETEVLLLRVLHAEKPTAYSLRLDVDRILRTKN